MIRIRLSPTADQDVLSQFIDIFEHFACSEGNTPFRFIGEMRRLFDVITDGQLQWAPMDPCYDRIIVGDRTFDFVAGRGNFAAELKGKFPAEADAIDRYLELVEKVARASPRFFAGQAMPPALGRAYAAALRDLLVPSQALKTTREVLESLTQNQELIGILDALNERMGQVADEAQAVTGLAEEQDFTDIGRQADSLRQQLLSARNKLNLLRTGLASF